MREESALVIGVGAVPFGGETGYGANLVCNDEMWRTN